MNKGNGERPPAPKPPALGPYTDDEPDTSPGLPPLGSMPPMPEDRDETIGVIYAETARNGRHIATLKRDYGVVRSELTHIRKDLELDRGALVEGASKHAAKHASNRVAALVGILFAVYEAAAPYVWRLLHK